MNAWLLHSFTGLDGLVMGEVEEPRAGVGEVVLEVLYAGLNPADRYLAEAQYPAKPEMPHILGRDAIGIVREIGPGVDDVAVGEKRVLLRSEIGVNRPGTFAQRVVVPAESLVKSPADWADEEAGGAALVYLTAYQAISMWSDLPKPATVLVTGASGGVGLACVHLAKAMGHTVVGQSRNAEKSKQLIAQGADLVLDPMDANWPAELKKQLGKKIDLAVDNIGGELFNAVVGVLGDRGRVSCVGRLAGPVPNFNTASLFFRRIHLGGVNVGAYTAAESRTAWERIVALLKSRGCRPMVDSIFEFADLKAAFDKLSRGPMGKVLLRVSP